MTGESLLKYSDEICEAMHSQYRIFEEKHKYTNNNKNTDSHKKSQLKSMVHFNGLNLGDVEFCLKINVNMDIQIC